MTLRCGRASGFWEESLGYRSGDGQEAVIASVAAHQLQADGEAVFGEAGRDGDGGVGGHGDAGAGAEPVDVGVLGYAVDAVTHSCSTGNGATWTVGAARTS